MKETGFDNMKSEVSIKRCLSALMIILVSICVCLQTAAESGNDGYILEELRYNFILHNATDDQVDTAIGLVSYSAERDISYENIALLMVFYLEKGLSPDESLRLAEEQIVREILLKHREQLSSDESFVFDPEEFLIDIGGFIGIRYQWGGESHQGTDCSGFSWNIMSSMGVSVPRMRAVDYYNSDNFVEIDGGSLQPGDLVFFTSGNGNVVNHMGIYLGNDKFAHASKGAGKVQVDDLNKSYWSRHWAGARRPYK